LKGGTQITIESSSIVDEQKLENILSQYDANVRTAKGITAYSVFIEFDTSVDPKDVMKSLEDNGYKFENYSIQTVGPALGETFLQQAQIVLIFAFIFMGITSFIIFRSLLPSFYVVLSAFADIVETLVISQILGIRLSLATFAALLLLIGYSVDDDVLLTTRIFKGTGDLKNKMRAAMKTAFTMIGATSVALLALFIITTSAVITQIASILLIGLLCDVVNTWLLNANLLRWHMERKMK